MSAESNGNSTMTTEKVEQEGRSNAKFPVPLLLVLLFLVFFLGGFTYLVLSGSKAPRLSCVHGSDGEASCNLIITKPVASKIGTIRVQRESDIFISLEKPFVVERPVKLVNGNTLPAGEYWKLKIKKHRAERSFHVPIN